MLKRSNQGELPGKWEKHLSRRIPLEPTVMRLLSTCYGYLIQKNCIPKLEAINHECLLDFQQREEDKNMTTKGKKTLINETTFIQKLMR